MLHHLTCYLLQYKTLSLPGVGLLRLQQTPPQLNVADRRLDPPSFAVELHQANENEAEVPAHQLSFLAAETGQQHDEILQTLTQLGETIRRRQNSDGFEWAGLGTITNNTSLQLLKVPALQPLPAERVSRPDAPHNVLVGDRNISSATITEGRTAVVHPRKARSVLTIIAWILLALSIVAIAVLLYTGKFRVNAAGSHLPVGYSSIFETRTAH